MPKREAEICERLRQARVSTGCTRVEIGKRAGIDATRLQSYELGRVVLPFGVAYKVAREADVNLRWLVTGKLPNCPCISLDQAVIEAIPERMVLSHVYDAVLEDEFALVLNSSARAESLRVHELSPDSLIFSDPIGIPEDMALLNVHIQSLTEPRRLLHVLPFDLRRVFAQKLQAFTDSFKMKHQREIEDFTKEKDARIALQRAEITAQYKKRLGIG